MATWNNATKTEKGLALDQKVLVSSLPLRITAARSGAGKVNPTQLIKQKELSSLKQDLELVQPYLASDGTATIPVRLTNGELAEGYKLYQVGLFAEDPDEGEILYFIAQTDLESGEDVPSKTESPGYSIDWNFCIKGSMAANIEVAVNAAGSMPADQGQYKTNLLPAAENLSDTGQIPMYNADTGQDVKVTLEQIKAYVCQDAGNTKTLKFKNVPVPVSAWTADTVFEEFPYRAVITLAGVTPDWICKTITPDYTDRSLDFLFCPYVSTGTGNLSIWAREIPDHDITFENICCEEVLENVQ